MLHTATLNIPESILEQFHCSSCNGYLSCGPVRVLPDGSCICGRCSPLSSDVPVYRVIAFEAVLSKTLFPCRFNQRGCKEFLLFGQAIEHELKCPYRSFICPLLLVANCTWEGSASEMLAHFNKKHENFIKEDIKFKIQVDENAQGISMIIKDGTGFIVKYHYDYIKSDLKYDIRYCKNGSTVDASYKIQLLNDADTDCSVGLKATKCSSYHEDLYDLQNPTVLNLNNFLQNLDNPSCVIIKFSITQSGDNSATGCNINYDVLNSLRCEKCHNYLIPPLFDLEGRAICCDCVKSNPQCTPSHNAKLQKLVTEAKFPCRWRDCKFIGKSEHFKVHELTCQFRHYDCFFPSCQVTFKLTSAIDHLQTHRAQYLPEKIIYKTLFSQPYSVKHLFTIKNNIIILIQHSMIDSDSDSCDCYTHRVALFSSDPCEISGNVDFEHRHCKLKSKRFVLLSKHNTDINFSELPPCFKSNDELSVTVNV